MFLTPSRSSLAFLALLSVSSVAPARSDFVREPMMVGFDCDMAYQYRQLGLTWQVGGTRVDLMRFMSLNGSSWVRIGVGTNATGSLSIDLALKSIRWARESALRVDIFFYLSSVGADLGKQPAPVGWANMTVEARASAAREHLRSCASALVRENCTDHLYEVGNEIDYGVCGSFVSDPGRWPEIPENIEFLKSTVWQDEALILREAIAGLREADPGAKVVLHLAHWWNLTFCLEFYAFMRSQSVPFDYVGLSYYPSSGIYDLGAYMVERRADADKSALEFNRTVRGLIAHDHRVLICEFAYPCSSEIPGMFGSFDKQLSGYPLDVDGQARFIEDTYLWLYDRGHVVGAFYFAPHFYRTALTDVWTAFALFDENGEARPGLYSIGELAALESELGAQREARESMLLAWDAIESSESSGKTEGLQEARRKAEEAWNSYISGMFGRATVLANEAAEKAKTAANPVLRAVFLAIILAIVAAGITAVAVFVTRRRRQSGRPLSLDAQARLNADLERELLSACSESHTWVTMRVVSIRLDDALKRRMQRLSYINWSEVIREAMAQRVEEEWKERRVDVEALLRAKAATDKMRRPSPGWSGVEEIRKWRDLRRP